VCMWRREKKKEGEWVGGRLFFFSPYVWRGAHGRCVCED
jgi:hypothetical protein